MGSTLIRYFENQIFTNTTCIFFLSGCTTSTQKVEVTVPLCLDDQTKVAILVFSARPANLGSPGHAYIQVRSYPQIQTLADLGIGLFPKSGGKLEPEPLNATPPSQVVTVKINQDQYDRIINLIEEWQLFLAIGTKHYDIFSENCVNFVHDIAQEVGLVTPNYKYKLPSNYVEELAELNTKAPLPHDTPLSHINQ